jgi:hypothetical protein
MSGGPSWDINRGPGARPYGNVDVGLGKGCGVSNVGTGVVYTLPTQPNTQVWGGVSQSRGGNNGVSNAFGGKPQTTFGVGARFRF